MLVDIFYEGNSFVSPHSIHPILHVLRFDIMDVVLVQSTEYNKLRSREIHICKPYSECPGTKQLYIHHISLFDSDVASSLPPLWMVAASLHHHQNPQSVQVVHSRSTEACMNC